MWEGIMRPGVPVRGEEMERVRAVGLGHRGGQLRHLQEPHHGPVHRVPGQPGQRHQRGVHSGLGDVQPRLPLPLHLQVAQDQERLPPVQPGLGVPEIRKIENELVNKIHQCDFQIVNSFIWHLATINTNIYVSKLSVLHVLPVGGLKWLSISPLFCEM